MFSGILKQLMDKIREDMQTLDDSEDATQIKKHFDNTLQHIRQAKDESGSYDGVAV